MATEYISVNKALITWAREKAGFGIEGLKNQDPFKKIERWESGKASPTYVQLEQMSEKFKIPVAVFFFPEPPEMPPIEKTFRTLNAMQIKKIPPCMHLLLGKARALQISLAELNDGKNPAARLITRDPPHDPCDSIEDLAVGVRKYLGVSTQQQSQWEDDDKAFKEWRKIFHSAGIHVFKDAFSKPGEEHSGFCLHDKEFPIIYVNNSKTASRQIFTLFHELAHLLFHSSGVFDDNKRLEEFAREHQKIEKICNQMASSVLVPEKEFMGICQNREPTEENIGYLAKHFRVSPKVILRKFLGMD